MEDPKHMVVLNSLVACAAELIVLTGDERFGGSQPISMTRTDRYCNRINEVLF